MSAASCLASADDWRERLNQTERQRQHQGIMSESGIIAGSSRSFLTFLPAPGFLQGVGHLARHVAFVMLGKHRSAAKMPPGSSLPSATTP